MLKFAWQNLFSRPLRTTLSVVGLTIAIAGMVGLFSIAGGIDRLVSSTFELVPGLLVQQRGAPMPLFSALPADWETELKQVPGVRVVNAEVLARVNRIEQKSILSPPRFLLGVDIEDRLLLEHGVYDEHLLPGGRFLQASDRGTTNCVISRTIAEQFDRQVGDTLTVNGVELSIVGLYHCGSMILDVNILLDLDMVREMARIDRQTVNAFYVESDRSIPDDELARRIERHFVGRNARLWEPSLLQKMLLQTFTETDGESPGRGVNAQSAPRSEADEVSTADENQDSPVEVRTQQDWSERFDDFTADLNVFLTIMTTVGLAIAVSSIINTMLMSVTERMIEFGILRANGWTRRNVMQLITFESALLGLAGGLCGIAVGWAAVQGINAWQIGKLRLFAGPQLLAFALLFSTLLGILGGLYPAWRAASKSPMEAIRRMG